MASERGRTICVDDDEVLELELERALVFWTTRSGPHRSLRTSEDWAWSWLKWADVLLPKMIEHAPGHRPAAMYAAGLIPPRPLTRRLPLAWKGRGVVVEDGRGGSTCHYSLPAPYQRPEVFHLAELGLVDDDEVRRWRERRGRRPENAWTFEIARFR